MIAAFSIAATFWLGTTDFTVDIDATFALTMPLPQIQLSSGTLDGFAIPHVIFIDATYAHQVGGTDVALLKHELGHARQYAALGPALPIAYALTFGHPFEDYQPSTTWHPPRNMENNCPLLRLTNTNWEVMPCWHLPF